MAVDGTTTTWVNGDAIKVNNTVAYVETTDGVATLNVGELTAPFKAVSPATIYSPNIGASTPYITVSLPSTYTYSENAGKQVLDAPMVAYSTEGKQLNFQHITGAIVVHVENNFGVDILVNSIKLTSSGYQLCGNKQVTFATSISVAAAATSNTSIMSVTMNCGFTLAPGQYKDVQIPVLPVGSDNRFTVEVRTENGFDPSIKYNFSRTQSTGGAILRRQLAYAPVIYGGKFSYGSGDSQKAYFSPGNLQYQASTNTWRFATRQCDAYAGSANGGNKTNATDRQTQALWIDLFGWGCSGWNGSGVDTWTAYQPWAVDATDAHYGPGTTSIYANSGFEEGDWAWHNSISNGGNASHMWFTPRQTQWDYLFNRSANAYAYARVDAHNGVILFCDNYSHPSELAAINYSRSSYDDNVITWANWQKMEIAGAVFLPAGGYRGAVTSTGEYSVGSGLAYWSTTSSGSTAGAKQVSMEDSVINTNKGQTRHYGCSIRPIRQAN